MEAAAAVAAAPKIHLACYDTFSPTDPEYKENSVKRLASLPIAALVCALIYPPLAGAELILPQSADDFRALAKPANAAPCEQCGIVTDVRSATRQATRGRTPAATPAAAVGDNVAPTPIIGSGARNSRQANKPVTSYQLTVRQDDGSYAFFEQDEQPTVVKGDRVEIIDGRVVARPAP